MHLVNQTFLDIQVCSSNMNRSMEAHKLLAQEGLQVCIRYPQFGCAMLPVTELQGLPGPLRFTTWQPA